MKNLSEQLPQRTNNSLSIKRYPIIRRGIRYACLITLAGLGAIEYAYQKNQQGKPSAKPDHKLPDTTELLSTKTTEQTTTMFTRELKIADELVPITCICLGNTVFLECENSTIQLSLKKEVLTPIDKVHNQSRSNQTLHITPIAYGSVENTKSTTILHDTSDNSKNNTEESPWYLAFTERVQFILQETTQWSVDHMIQTLEANPSLITQCPTTQSLVAELGIATVRVDAKYLEEFLYKLREAKQIEATKVTFALPISITIENSIQGNTVHHCTLYCREAQIPEMPHEPKALIAQATH